MLLGLYNLIKLLAYPVFVLFWFMCNHLGWTCLAIVTLLVMLCIKARMNIFGHLGDVAKFVIALWIVISTLTFLLSLLVGVKF